jgi:glutathione S-transferase
MIGDRLTMADLPLACEFDRWSRLPQPRTAWPHLDRWFDSICARPSSQGALGLELA